MVHWKWISWGQGEHTVKSKKMGQMGRGLPRRSSRTRRRGQNIKSHMQDTHMWHIPL